MATDIVVCMTLNTCQKSMLLSQFTFFSKIVPSVWSSARESVQSPETTFSPLPNTTSRVLPCRPEGSGYRNYFLRRATSRTAPSTSAQWCEGLHPAAKPRPAFDDLDATFIELVRHDNVLFWILMLVVTSHPLHDTRVRLPTPQRTHDSQEPPPQRMLLGGHWTAHTGKHGWTRTEGASSGEEKGAKDLCVERGVPRDWATREGRTLASAPLWERNVAPRTVWQFRPHRGCDETLVHGLCCQVLLRGRPIGEHRTLRRPTTWRTPAAPSKWIPRPRSSNARTMTSATSG